MIILSKIKNAREALLNSITRTPVRKYTAVTVLGLMALMTSYCIVDEYKEYQQTRRDTYFPERVRFPILPTGIYAGATIIYLLLIRTLLKQN